MRRLLIETQPLSNHTTAIGVLKIELLVQTALTRRLHSNLLKKACFSLTCDLLLCVGERLFSTSLKAIESIFKVGIVGLRGLSLYFNVCMTIAETLTLL